MAPAVVAVAAIFAAACTPVTRTADRFFEAGAFGRASQEYALLLELDEPVPGRDRVLYRAALAHAIRRSPTYDLARTSALFDQLIAEYPHSPYALSAQAMMDWVERSQRLEGWVVLERRRVEGLEADIVRLRAQMAAADAAVAENDSQTASLLDQLAAKDQRLRALTQQLAAATERLDELTTELAEIRKLDLAEPP